MSRTEVFERFRPFKEGRILVSVESDERPGRPSTSRNRQMMEEVRSLLVSDGRVTIREISEDVAISKARDEWWWSSSHQCCTAAQKENRLFAATDLLQAAKSDAEFLGNIITGDETWIYGYGTETKAQLSVCRSPSSSWPKEARQVRSKTKVLLTVSSSRCCAPCIHGS
jgi:hypothetical protein